MQTVVGKLQLLSWTVHKVWHNGIAFQVSCIEFSPFFCYVSLCLPIMQRFAQILVFRQIIYSAPITSIRRAELRLVRYAQQ